MTIETLVAIVVPLLALGFTAMSFRRTENHDTSAAATERATLTADVRYIRSSIDEIKLENKSIQKDVSELSRKMVQIEESTKSAHKRIDEMIEGYKHHD